MFSGDTCGGELIASAGRISYKPNQTYDANERCIWTIRMPNYGYDMSVDVYHFGEGAYLLESRILDADSGQIYDTSKL